MFMAVPPVSEVIPHEVGPRRFDPDQLFVSERNFRASRNRKARRDMIPE
jgi:hypothetical protein